MRKQYQPKTIHTANMPWADQEFRIPPSPPVLPFITIAQQIGAECVSLPERLAEAINHRVASEPAWAHWDQKLIDKVSADNQIPADLVASLDISGHSWVDDVLSGISGRMDEMVVFHRLKETIRDLARAGHVILVGHGSTFMTHDLAGGLHIRLIAPMSFRTNNLSSRLNLSPREAARQVRRLDRHRRAFLARYGLGLPFKPEMFATIFNIAELDEKRLIRAIVAMLPETPETA